MIDEIINAVYMFVFENGKKYVGITTRDPEIRKKEHLSCSRKPNPKYMVHKTIKLYGGENSFNMIILAETDNTDELKSLEVKYIHEHNTYFKNGLGYNMTLGGEGNFGYKFTDEIKQKMSQIKTEFFKNNPERVEKWKEMMKNFWTEEQRLKMSILKKEQIKNNPQITVKWRESRGEWTDDQKEKQSLIVKKQFENNPERAKQISERMKISGNTLDGKIRGEPKQFDVHRLTGEYIGTYEYVPFAVNDILNEKKLLDDISENTLGKSIRRVLSGERNHTKGFTFVYKV